MTEEYPYRQDGSRAIRLGERTKTELIEELLLLRKKLAQSNSFGLSFERQPEDAILNRRNKIPILIEDKDKYIENGGETNLLLVGDNFDSLTNLLQTHKKQIGVIYIDPPYNTGNEDFIYNDNYVNEQDSWRHSKWLSFMERRLILAKELLTEDGVIFISIDDTEQASLKLLMDSIFKEENFLGNIIWNKGNNQNDADALQRNHEYILLYAKNKTQYRNVNTIFREKTITSDGENWYELGAITNGSSADLKSRPNLGYTFYYNPATGDLIPKKDYDEKKALHSNNIDEVYQNDEELISKGYVTIRPPKKGRLLGRWTWSLQKAIEERDLLVVIETKNGFSIRKKNIIETELPVIEKGKKASISYPVVMAPKSIMNNVSSEGSRTLNNIFGEKVFDYSKPVSLIEELLSYSTKKDTIVLDFFAGSGTTGQAVLELNKKDGGNRRFILCTNDEAGIGESVTYERIRRVITGNSWADDVERDTYQGTLRYFKVDFVGRDNLSLDSSNNFNELIKIAENCFMETQNTDLITIWEDYSQNKVVSYLRDSWAVQELIEFLSTKTPSYLVVYINDNGADYSSEFNYLSENGWDIKYVSLNDFIFEIISFVDEKNQIIKNEKKIAIDLATEQKQLKEDKDK